MKEAETKENLYFTKELPDNNIFIDPESTLSIYLYCIMLSGMLALIVIMLFLGFLMCMNILEPAEYFAKHWALFYIIVWVPGLIVLGIIKIRLMKIMFFNNKGIAILKSFPKRVVDIEYKDIDSIKINGKRISIISSNKQYTTYAGYLIDELAFKLRRHGVTVSTNKVERIFQSYKTTIFGNLSSRHLVIIILLYPSILLISGYLVNSIARSSSMASILIIIVLTSIIMVIPSMIGECKLQNNEIKIKFPLYPAVTVLREKLGKIEYNEGKYISTIDFKNFDNTKKRIVFFTPSNNGRDINLSINMILALENYAKEYKIAICGFPKLVNMFEPLKMKIERNSFIRKKINVLYIYPKRIVITKNEQEICIQTEDVVTIKTKIGIWTTMTTLVTEKNEFDISEFISPKERKEKRYIYKVCKNSEPYEFYLARKKQERRKSKGNAAKR